VINAWAFLSYWGARARLFPGYAQSLRLWSLVYYRSQEWSRWNKWNIVEIISRWICSYFICMLRLSQLRLYRIFASYYLRGRVVGQTRHLVFGRIVAVGPNTNSDHETSVSAYASLRHLQLQSSRLKLFRLLMISNQEIEKDDFWTSWISLFTELERSVTFVHYSYLVA